MLGISKILVGITSVAYMIYLYQKIRESKLNQRILEKENQGQDLDQYFDLDQIREFLSQYQDKMERSGLDFEQFAKELQQNLIESGIKLKK
tara:strand:+ start:457 stop:729 length:273 start_codon:yes stop_codon:yes gene_type:complete